MSDNKASAFYLVPKQDLFHLLDIKKKHSNENLNLPPQADQLPLPSEAWRVNNSELENGRYHISAPDTETFGGGGGVQRGGIGSHGFQHDEFAGGANAMSEGVPMFLPFGRDPLLQRSNANKLLSFNDQAILALQTESDLPPESKYLMHQLYKNKFNNAQNAMDKHASSVYTNTTALDKSNMYGEEKRVNDDHNYELLGKFAKNIQTSVILLWSYLQHHLPQGVVVNWNKFGDIVYNNKFIPGLNIVSFTKFLLFKNTPPNSYLDLYFLNELKRLSWGKETTSLFSINNFIKNPLALDSPEEKEDQKKGRQLGKKKLGRQRQQQQHNDFEEEEEEGHNAAVLRNQVLLFYKEVIFKGGK